jgi:hypothetical protein
MTLQDSSQVTHRKIDEVRKDVRYLHPLMEWLDPATPIPAEDLIDRLLGKLDQISEEQNLMLTFVMQVMTKMEQLEASQTRMARIFDMDLDDPLETPSRG